MVEINGQKYEAQDGGKYGIDTLKAVIKFAGSLRRKIQTVTRDNRVTFFEKLSMLSYLPEVVSLASSARAMGQEVSDLSSEEVRELAFYAAAELGIPLEVANGFVTQEIPQLLVALDTLKDFFNR